MTERALKILHVVPYFPPDRMGGVGEVAAHLHRGLLERGHVSHVLSGGFSENESNIERIASTAFGFLCASARYRSKIDRWDLMHCHHGESLPLVLLNRIRKTRTPVLLTLHSSCAKIARAHRPYRAGSAWFGRDLKTLLRRFGPLAFRHLLDRSAMRLVDGVNYISRQGAIDLLGPEHGSKAKVIRNALPPLEAPPQPGPAFQTVDLLYAGASNVAKRVHLLPVVLAEIRKHIPHATLRIAGFNPDQDAGWGRLCADLGVTQAIDVVGHIPSSELKPVYTASRVLLHPSAYEGLPMALLEAMQCGLPVVATGAGGIPEVIDNDKNGFLVPLDDTDTMAKRCLQLLGDPDLRARFAKAGQQTIATRFTLDRQLEEYLALYCSIRKSNPP
jgi:glycosyltransferase involved in cell wall biosynthesis